MILYLYYKSLWVGHGSHQLSVVEVSFVLDSDKHLGSLMESDAWHTTSLDDWVSFVWMISDADPAVSLGDNTLKNLECSLLQNK